MRAKIFSFLKLHGGSVMPSVRIARFLSAELQIPVTTGADVVDEDLDALIIVNGAFAFCDVLAELGSAIERAGRLIWVQNDYTIIIPKTTSGAESPFRKAFRNREARGQSRADFWTTCERESRSTPLSRYVNWNCLTLDEITDSGRQDWEAKIKSRRERADDSLLYYGSFRTQRADAFNRYFSVPMVPTVISSPSKKFAQIYDHELVEHLPKIGVDEDFYETIGTRGAGLYLEDRLSHSEYHSPANRFYEMLSAGLPMMFQPECGASLRKGGYNPEVWMVRKSLDVQRGMPHREEWGEHQRYSWLPKARQERADLSGRVRGAWGAQS